MILSYHFTSLWQAVLYTSQNAVQKHRKLLMTGGSSWCNFGLHVMYVEEIKICAIQFIEL